jgi:hypothetical protein
MPREKRLKSMTVDELNEIIRIYDVNQIKLSEAYGDGGAETLRGLGFTEP